MTPVVGATRQRPRASALAVALVLLLAVVVPVRATLITSLAAPIVEVNSTGDGADASPGDGVCATDSAPDPDTGAECTLRAAIEEANSSSVDHITFAVPADPDSADGIVTITPATPLPTLVAATTLDATTQDASSATPVVVIDGSASGTGPGLHVQAGPSVVAGFVVHSFAGDGIIVNPAAATTVRDNHVGVDETGLAAPGNDGAGIRVEGGADNVVRDNVIGGNAGAGVLVKQGPLVTVRGNRIGIGTDGATPLGNVGAGIEVAVPSSSRVRIGGVGAGDGNVVAHNDGPGVTLRTGGLDDVSVLSNSIHSNAGLGIDLNDDGPTPNDLGDLDGGANNSLNTPEPTLADQGQVTFDLDVQAGDHRIEVFRNPTEGADPLGSGEGEQLVGSGTITHAGTGPASFTVAGLAGVVAGDVLSLTATEVLDDGEFGSTSEFSATVVAEDGGGSGGDGGDTEDPVVTVNDSGDDVDVDVGDGVCDTGERNVEDAPACTLRAALQEADASAAVETIAFAVPATDAGTTGGVVTIAPGSPLPPVPAAVTIDGTTQSGFAGDPVVAIDGTAVVGDLLTADGAGTSIVSLALHGGPGHGVSVTADDVTILDTWIGLAPGGAGSHVVRGVAGDGIRVDGAARVAITGSAVVGSGGNGVSVVGPAADDVAVLATTLRGNRGLGIDLGDDGVTPNDPGDADLGPNGLHNRPVVTGATGSAGAVSLDVALDQAAGDVLLQVYTTPTPHPSGAGEGDTIVHSTTVPHPGGTATHTLSFAGAPTDTFALTATEDLGGGAYGATSEFSDTVTQPVATDDPGSVPATVAAADPLSYWRLGEASGPTTYDEGSLANHGTSSGGVVRGAAGALAGDADTATGLDGTDDVVIVPHDPGYLLDEGALSLWVHVEDLTVAQVPFSKEADGLGTGGHTELRIEPDGAVVHRLATTTGEVEVTSAAGAVTSGRWHHLAVTFGPRGTELWVDGSRVGADPHGGGWGPAPGGSGNAEPILLGASGATSGDGAATPTSDHLTGRLDEVAVFGTQLDGATIAALAGAAPQHLTVDSGAVLSVPAGSGVLVNDHDADGDALTASLRTGPTRAASFALQPDGSFTYASTAGFSGTDSFTYTVSDGVTAPVTATATITVEPALGHRVVADATGNGHDGTPAGGMTSADAVGGRIGGALDLDGIDDHVVINNLDVAGDELTLSAWVDPDTIGSDPVVLAKAVGLGDADVRWRLLLADTSATTANAVGSVGTTGGLASAMAPAATGVADGWTHVAVRYDGSQVVLFVDGTAVATAAHSGTLLPDPSVDAAIGALPDGGQAFDGRIDEVRVSHTARSDAWLALEHATQDDPTAAITVGATETSASAGWTASTAQARSGSTAALAPSGVLRSWLTLDGVAEGGLAAEAWWRVTTLTGLDLGQGVRAGDATGSGPIRQDETGLFDASGWDLGQVDTTRTRLTAPPAGQAPTTDAWHRVEVRIDQTDALSATASGVDVPLSGTDPAGVAPTGTVGFRVGMLDPAARWWVDDLRVRRYVTPEPVATLRRTELAP